MEEVHTTLDLDQRSEANARPIGQLIGEIMTLEQIAYAAEIVAALGVIVSLIYVARELSQNNDLVEAQARASRASSRLAILELTIANPDVCQAMSKSVSGEELSLPEEILLANVQGYIFTQWQYVFGEYQAGLIGDADLPIEGWRVMFRGSHIVPAMSETWRRTGRIAYRKDFAEWMENTIVN